MSRHYRGFVALQSGIATGTGLKTLLQVKAGTNHAIKITELSISFNGTSNTDPPVLCDLIRQTSAGTMTALTVQKLDDSQSDTLDTTAAHSATVEPTDSGQIVWAERVHPQQGIRVYFPKPIIVGAGDRIGLRTNSGVSYSGAVVQINGEETDVRGFTVSVSGLATGTTPRTMLQVQAATNHALVVKELAASFNSIDNTDVPVLVELVRQTTQGNMVSAAAELQQHDDSNSDSLGVAAFKFGTTGEPTGTTVVWAQRIHPQPGLRWELTPIVVGAGDRLGLRVTANEDYSSSSFELVGAE